MNDKALRAIKQYKMLEQGDRVVVGVSGGADSVALLHFLWVNRARWNLTVEVCHINHHLRGEESNRDEWFVQKLCQSYRVPFHLFSFAASEESAVAGRSVEEYSREKRYAFFERIAGEERAKIATAHTLNDKMETMLFHLARGTGGRGLKGIPAVRGQIIRPLIGCTREEIEYYCKENHLDYVTDSSNLTDEYSRNFIRHHLVPNLYRLNPAVHRALENLSVQMQRDMDCLERLSEEAFQKLWQEDGLNQEGFLQQPEAIRTRLIEKMLKSAGTAADYERITELNQAAGRLSFTCQLGQNLFWQCRNGRIQVVSRLPETPPFEHPVPELLQSENQKILLFAGKSMSICRMDCEQFNKFKKFGKYDLKNVLDYDKINGVMTFRCRRAGDALRQKARGCTKSLKKLFNEAKIPFEKRSAVAVLADVDGVIWVEDFGADERVLPWEQTKNFLLIELLEGTE